MKVAALLTGRGNNTLRDKNVLAVLGRPLLQYPALAARRSSHIRDFYCSSDDAKILAAATAVGYKPIRRPDELARPDSQHVDAIHHALGVMRAAGVDPEILVVILANCATTLTKWIDECIEILLSDPIATAVVPAYLDMDHHPFRAKRVARDGALEPFFDFAGRAISTNRQDLEPCYFLCHNFWVLRVRSSIDTCDGAPPWTFMGRRVRPYEVEETIDIHHAEDVTRTEQWLRAHAAPEELDHGQ